MSALFTTFNTGPHTSAPLMLLDAAKERASACPEPVHRVLQMYLEEPTAGELLRTTSPHLTSTLLIDYLRVGCECQHVLLVQLRARSPARQGPGVLRSGGQRANYLGK